eukprot:scaffold3457_cov230-Pinguiococcus_pyrenoidosus.AAC.7
MPSAAVILELGGVLCAHGEPWHLTKLLHELLHLFRVGEQLANLVLGLRRVEDVSHLLELRLVGDAHRAHVVKDLLHEFLILKELHRLLRLLLKVRAVGQLLHDLVDALRELLGRRVHLQQAVHEGPHRANALLQLGQRLGELLVADGQRLHIGLHVRVDGVLPVVHLPNEHGVVAQQPKESGLRRRSRQRSRLRDGQQAVDQDIS